MINVEDIIGEVLKPLRQSNDIGLYHYGNEYELKEVMNAKDYQAKYPFVWLVLPFESNPTENLDRKELRARVKLILSTSTELSWLNTKRNIETYKKILNPLYDNVIDAFTKSYNITIVEDEVNVKKLHNYYKSDLGTRSNPQKKTVNDYWDVILMEFDGIFKPIQECNL